MEEHDDDMQYVTRRELREELALSEERLTERLTEHFSVEMQRQMRAIEEEFRRWFGALQDQMAGVLSRVTALEDLPPRVAALEEAIASPSSVRPPRAPNKRARRRTR